MIELARQANVKLIGPSSIGIASPGHSVVGSLSGSMIDPDQKQFLAPSDNGGVAIISKSGGMANTIANMLTNEGIAQTTIAGIGGDRLIGTSFADLLPLIEADGETKATVIIGEFGGSYEEDLAAAITALQQPCKPIIAFISGLFAQTLPQGVSFGHAGAIVSKTVGTREGKITALENAGVIIAQTPTDIPNLLKQSI
jgi:succinyl-CoA synthetase alpha subunit